VTKYVEPQVMGASAAVIATMIVRPVAAGLIEGTDVSVETLMVGS
jgi:hypothetical protein